MQVVAELAPDLDDEGVVEVARASRALGLAGVVATNTTVARTGLATSADEVAAVGVGGLSGPPLAARVSWVDLASETPHALSRTRVEEPLTFGVRALDTLVPCGKGQRLGIFAGSGVGKSSLLAQITRGTDADVRVIGLIGERGREVREFLEENLGAEGMARTVVVVATSDEPPLVRLKAAFVATRIAEAFRDQGRDVLLLMDSITRTAMAQREVGLSAGEPPATRGYPPSVFAMMPQLLEKAGTGDLIGLDLVARPELLEQIAPAALAAAMTRACWPARSLKSFDEISTSVSTPPVLS